MYEDRIAISREYLEKLEEIKRIKRNRSSYKIPEIPDMSGDIPDEIRYRYWGIMTKHIRDEKDKSIGRFVNLAENIFKKYDVDY
jgi:hypothetical protein